MIFDLYARTVKQSFDMPIRGQSHHWDRLYIGIEPDNHWCPFWELWSVSENHRDLPGLRR